MSINLITLIEKKIQSNKNCFHRMIFVTKTRKYLRYIIGAYDEPKIICLKEKQNKKGIPVDTEGEVIEYRRIDTILGSTVDILVLDDFYSITPNIVAKALETVGGGGSIVIFIDELPTQGYWKRFFKNLRRASCGIFLDEIQRCKHQDAPQNKVNSWVPPLSHNKILSLSKSNSQFNICQGLIEDLSSDQFISLVISSRGRGKSATLGLVLATALTKNYKLIHILAPNLENVQTIFYFIKKGLEVLGFNENIDFESHLNHRKLIYRLIFVKKAVIEYIHPRKNDTFHDLLVIDEAASIDASILCKKLKKSKNLLLASTAQGYEGTGQFFTKKLLGILSMSKFKRYELTEPIRYSNNDPVENFLIKNLLLDNDYPPNVDRLLPIDSYELYHVNKNLLLRSEPLLQSISQLLAASHYRNSPDDIFQLIENPAHQLFLLLGCEDENILDRIIGAIHVVIESGTKREGNLFRNTIKDHFDVSIDKTIGIRIFRLAVHSEFVRKGFGTLCIQKLTTLISESNKKQNKFKNNQENEFTIKGEDPKILFSKENISFPFIDYLCVSFGYELGLYNFWRKNDFIPLYLHHKPSNTTGAYSILMIQKLEKINLECLDWDLKVYEIFRSRFLSLLSFYFKDWKASDVHDIISINQVKDNSFSDKRELSTDGLKKLSTDNIYRLKKYYKGMLLFFDIIDIFPQLSLEYFNHGFLFLSRNEELLLIKIGLMHSDIDEFHLEINQPIELVNSWIFSLVKKFIEFYKA